MTKARISQSLQHGHELVDTNMNIVHFRKMKQVASDERRKEAYSLFGTSEHFQLLLSVAS